MSLHDEVNHGIAALVSAIDDLEDVRQQWAKKLGMESPEELNAVQTEHAALMPLHKAQLRDNPSLAPTLKPHMDKLSAQVGQVAEMKSIMAVMDDIAANVAMLTERAKSIASSTKAAL